MSQNQLKQSVKSFFTKEINLYLVFAFFGIVISYIIYFWFPKYLYLIIEEDNLIENLSALSFLTAGFLGVWAVKKNYKSRKLKFSMCCNTFVPVLYKSA